MTKKKSITPAIQLNSWEFRFREDRGNYRVWRTNWSGDQFEVLSEKEFFMLQFFCRHFSIALREEIDE